jgi:sec-independent protein translocase protein TatB
MQFIGIGLPELLLILVLAVIVIGPERLPEFAGQLARWIRQARAYAEYVSRDFNEVISELEKEVGANREDLREIASVLRRDTGSVLEEINKAGQEVREAADLQKAVGTNVIPITGGSRQDGRQDDAAAPVDSTALKEAAMAPAEASPEELPAVGAGGSRDEPQAGEGDWFKPTPSRRRRRGGETT